jgi:hypothetical protein
MRLSRGTGVLGVAFAFAGGLGAISFFYFSSGCAQVLGVQTDRYLVDAGAGGVDAASAYPPGWECLAQPEPKADGGTVKLRWQLLNATNATSGNTSGTPIPGAAIHACTQIDFGCMNPFDDSVTDDGGIAILPVPSGFTGFYEVPNAPGFNPSLLFRPPQFVDQTQPQGLADSTDITLAGAVAGVTQDPNLSFAIVSVSDCTGASAGGIVFNVGSPGPNETVVYLLNSIPSKSATQTDAVTGSALIFNVPVNSQSLAVTAAFASNQQAIQKVTAVGRAGWVTYILLEPNQSTRPPL